MPIGDILPVGTLTYVKRANDLYVVIDERQSFCVSTKTPVEMTSLTAGEKIIAPAPLGGKQ